MPCPNCHCPSCLVLVGSTIPSIELPLPPSELMTTDRALTTLELVHCRDVIKSAEETFPLIEAVAVGLERKKAELLGLISAHRAAISPLRSFPPELLTEIFGHFVTMVETNPYSTCHPLLMLMRICPRWRRIVIGSPRLWTKISTAYPIVIDSWIIRSKELPLHLELDLCRAISHPILEALIPHSHRWEHVDFRLEPSASSLLARVRTRLPSLNRLSLQFGQIQTGTVDFCKVAPQLTEVELTLGVYEPVNIELPWEQLRVFTLDNSGFTCYVLQRAKNLWRLHLDMSRLFGPPWFRAPSDTHSYHLGLNTLIIEWSFMDPDMDLFFSSITLPSLRTLEVLFDYPDSEEIYFPPADANAERVELAPALAAFFERSCTQLSTLKLTDIPFSPRGVIKCLALAPSLISLDIQFDERWHAINKKLLHSLNVDHPRHVLPRLRSLSLRGQGAFPRKFLDALVTSRRDINPRNEGVALLENLTLECSVPDNQPIDQLPRFHRFGSEGLNITYGENWDVFNSIQDIGGPT